MQALTDPWVIGIGSALLGAMVTAVGRAIFRWFQAARGPFSGWYVALYFEEQGPVLVEVVKCRHSGRNLRGTIRSIATFDLGDLDEAKTSYRWRSEFSGFVEERVLVLSYKSRERGTHSVGAMAMKGDDVGKIFRGTWAGIAHGSVVSAKCHWVRVSPPRFDQPIADVMISHAKGYLRQMEGSASTGDVPSSPKGPMGRQIPPREEP
jgi:hypothetical protein